jgi:hypothetical protein
MGPARVKVTNPSNSWRGTECFIDDHKVKNVRSVDFHVGVDEIPTFEFETIGFPDIDMTGDVRFEFTPETVQEEAAVLQHEVRINCEFYNAFIAGIEDLLRKDHFKSTSELAEKITDRIFGLEK